MFCSYEPFHLISLSFQSTHPPWQSRPVHWPQFGAHTPISRSTPRAPGSSVAWGSRAPATSRPGCSAAHSRSVRRDTYTGTCSWGRRSGRSGRRHHPKHTQPPQELEEREKEGFVLTYVLTTAFADPVLTGHPVYICEWQHQKQSTHLHRYRSSCGRRLCSHTAVLYVCRRGSFQSRTVLSDERTPGSRHSRPGSGAPQEDTWGAP